jgi:hypothetical protein
MKEKNIDFEDFEKVVKNLSDYLIENNSCHGVGFRKDCYEGEPYIIVKVLPETKTIIEQMIKDFGLDYPYKIEECEMAVLFGRK